MTRDRRKSERGAPDRRGSKRRDLPWWGYALGLTATAIIFSLFWSLVYG